MIATERLLLRAPTASDRAAIGAMLTDQAVMSDLYPGLDEAAAAGVMDKHDRLRGEGLGFQAVVRRDDGAVVGFCGLKRGEPHQPIAGEVEAGWLIARDHWRQGYALEATAAVLAAAWPTIDADRIVAITARVNTASQAMMARLGMHHRGDFDSETFPEGHRLRPTVLYAIGRPA